MKLENFADNEQLELVVLIGLPGSGKSTWREDFLASSSKDFVVISSDDEIERMIQDFNDGEEDESQHLTYTTGFDKFVGAATGMMNQKVQDAVNSRKNIIWDQTNMSPKKRRGILQKVPSDEYHKTAVAFEVPDDELKRRLKRREKETGKSIPDKVIGSMAKSYSPPTKGEGFDKVIILR